MGEKIGGFYDAPGIVFRQGLYEQSSTQKHRIGTIRPLDDGRVFAYARAGETLYAGFALQAAVPDTYAKECAVASIAAVGDDHIHVTYGAGTTATAGYFIDGFIASVMVGYYPGPYYKIRGHAAATSGGNLKVLLYDKVREALSVSDKCTMIKHNQDGVIKSVAAALTGAPAGIAPIDVTSTYYFWNQVKGLCAFLCAGTAVIGDPLISTSTAGALGPGTAATDSVFGQVAYVPTDTYHGFIMLDIPGY